MPKPKWASPERQAHLIRLFIRSGGFCVFGESPCAHPELHHYEYFTDALVKDWIRDDREARAYMLKLQRMALHRMNEQGAIRGRFNSVSRNIFFDAQPRFYMEAIGISGLTFRPFAKVRLASSFTRLHVDISEPMKKVSKNRRRKAVRYSKALPVQTQTKVDSLCSKAVRDYLKI